MRRRLLVLSLSLLLLSGVSGAKKKKKGKSHSKRSAERPFTQQQTQQPQFTTVKRPALWQRGQKERKEGGAVN